MAINFSSKDVIGHIINGTLEKALCRICLKPLGEVCENIFTQFWLENKILSVADILKMLCKAEFSDNDNYNVCSDCIVEAFTAYNFYIRFKSTTKLLEDYVKEFEECVNSISNDSIFIERYAQVGLELKVKYKSKVEVNYDIQHFLSKKFEMCQEMEEIPITNEEQPKQDKKVNLIFVDMDVDNYSETGQDEFKMVPMKRKKSSRKKNPYANKRNSSKRINRFHLTKKQPKRCEICEIDFCQFQYLFNHSKKKHGLSYCDICPGFYNIDAQELHIKMHGDVYCCDTCKIIFEFRNDFINHLQCHDRKFVCEKCGYCMASPESYKSHYKALHNGRDYRCSYCGKQYVAELNYNRHMATHKILMENADKNLRKKEISMMVDEVMNRKVSRELCTECGASFVSRRVLLKHIRRKHTKDLPFICEVESCGSRFPTAGDRDDHMKKGHKPPTRRCPLCPSVYSTISGVNRHIETKHLKMKKRQGRSRCKHVTWATSIVTFEQIRVDIQHKIIDKVRAGQLELPEEMLTDNLRQLLNIDIEPERKVVEQANEATMRIYSRS